MSDADFTVDGLTEVQAALEGLPDHIRRTSLVGAIADAGALVRDAVREHAQFGQYSTGALRESIIFRASQIGGEPSGVVIPQRKGKGAKGYHAGLVEYGTEPHMEPWHVGGPLVIPHPGMRPEPFFWPAVDASSEQALDRMEELCGADAESYWNASDGAGARASGSGEGELVPDANAGAPDLVSGPDMGAGPDEAGGGAE